MNPSDEMVERVARAILIRRRQPTYWPAMETCPLEWFGEEKEALKDARAAITAMQSEGVK